MDDRRWRQIDALFEAVLEVDEEGRDAFLERECADDPELRRAVERLLGLEAEAGDFFTGQAVVPQLAVAELPSATTEDDLGGMRLGPYRLLRVLGHGGMGSVYLAQREDDYRQEVAIKLVRRGFLSREARRRLHAERQVLARLEHPNIARLYDGGTTDDGLPYLVMERVVGERIDLYCDQHRLGVRRRLALILEVLAAVAHAHQHLRVHCDIKPSNILVTGDGQPKLLDFGIAKLLSPEEGLETVTSTGRRPMTLGYASPEQVRGQPITTATDIYAVGVLLYELLCGRRPYSVTGDPGLEMGRAIVEQDPTAPSRRVAEPGGQTSAAMVAERRDVVPKELERQLRGDLDAIVLKAIRKYPLRRYASAEAFADDITRHLEARPVAARSDSWRYRAGRFWHRLVLPPDPRRRRERWAWTAVMLAVVGLSLFTLWLRRPPVPCQDSEERFADVWDAPRRAAVEEAFLASGLPFASTTWLRVSAVLHDYRQAWIAADQEICEATLVRGERSARLLDLGRLCLDGRRQEMQVLVDAFADADRSLVIDAVTAVGQLGSLRECSDQAELATRRLPPADPEIRQSLSRVRAVVEEQSLKQRFKEPVDFEVLRQAEAEARQLGDAQLTARILFVLGLAESFQNGDAEAGEAYLEEALVSAIAAGDRPHQARIYAALIKILSQQQGDFEQARYWQDFAVASFEALSSGYDGVEMEVFEALGILELYSGAKADAVTNYQRALASAERQGDANQQISALNQLGIVAEDLLYIVRAIEVIERDLGPDHVRLASPLMNLASAFSFEGRYEEALPLLRRSIELLRATHGDQQPTLGYPLTLLGQVLIALDRPREALDPLAQAIERIEAGFGSKADVFLVVNVAMAEALLLDGRLDEAMEYLKTTEATLEDRPADPGTVSRLFFLHVLGEAQRAAGDLDAALVAHLELLRNLDEVRADMPATAAKSLLTVAHTLQAAGRSDEVRPLLEEAAQGIHKSDRWMRARILFSLAETILREDPDRAERLVAEAAEGLTEELPLHQQLLEEIKNWQARQ